MQKNMNCTPENYQEEEIDYESKLKPILEIPDEFKSYYRNKNSKQVAEKLKVICLIGITGVGKSSTGNTLSGSKNFEESSKVQSCTQETTGKYFYWPAQNFTEENKQLYLQKDKETPFLIVDTPGLCDSNGRDTDNIVKMVCFLKNLAYVHSFVICFNSEDPRLDENKISILKLFSEMFGENFFDNVILCLTRWSYDKKEEAKRKIKKNGQDAVISQMNEEFKQKMRITLKTEQFIFIENDYSNADIRQYCEPYELEKNAEQLEILHNKTINNRAFWCHDLKEVMKENEKLAKKIQNMLQNQKQQQQSFQQQLQEQRKEAANKLKYLKNEFQVKAQEYQNQTQEQKKLREQEQIQNYEKQLQYEREIQEERKENSEKLQKLQSNLQDMENQKEQNRIERQKQLQKHEEELQELKEQSRIQQQQQESQEPSVLSQLLPVMVPLIKPLIKSLIQPQSQQDDQFFISDDSSQSSVKKQSHNGPRCIDGSLDMRYKVNKEFYKQTTLGPQNPDPKKRNF